VVINKLILQYWATSDVSRYSHTKFVSRWPCNGNDLAPLLGNM